MNSTPQILYVDDDPASCEMMSFLLSDRSRYTVMSAADGKEARGLIDSQHFDLFLLDYCLPDTTGVSLCQKIRESDPRVPIVIYSALDRDIDRQKAMDAGATEYFIKPDQLQSIKPEIDLLLQRYLRTQPRKAEYETETRRPKFSRPKRKASGIV